GDRRNHGKEEVQLRMLRHQRLNHKNSAVGIKSNRQPVNRNFGYAFIDDVDVLILRGEGMPVNDSVDALVFILHGNPVVEGSHQMSQVKSPGRAHATKDSLLHNHLYLYTPCG